MAPGPLAPVRRGLPWLETVLADVRHALRHFRRAPWATVTMISVLSLGLGTNVVLFTVASSISTLPPPGIERDPALVRIRGTIRMSNVPSAQERLLSWPEAQEYARHGELFSEVVVQANETGLVTTDAESAAPFTANLVYATPSYFTILDVHLALGTPPAAEPDVRRLTNPLTAVISSAMWERVFGGAVDVIGRVVRVNEHPVEIVGVAPPRFAGTGGSGALTVWLSLAAYPLLQRRTAAAFASTDTLFLSAIARLRPGVTATAAMPTVAGIADRMFRLERGGQATPGSTAGPPRREETAGADVVPLLAANYRVGDRTDQLVSQVGSGGFGLLVLLITCTNVSALLVGLAAARKREIGVRLALGAGRHRVIRQLLTEGVLLALGAAAVGLGLTIIGVGFISARFEDVHLAVDWRVASITGAVAVVTGILFSLSPAMHATRTSLADVLKRSAFVDAARSRLQRALVVGQVALTQPLLVGLGVLVATVAAEQAGPANTGAPERIAEVELDTWAGRVTAAERTARIAAAVERVAAMPGVTAAMPMQMGTITAFLSVDPTDRIVGASDVVGDARLVAAPKGYFATFGLPIVRGRDFTAGEYTRTTNDVLGPGSFQAVIVEDGLARRLWGGADPLGRRLRIGSPETAGTAAMVVVGVAADGDGNKSRIGDRARVYVPYAPMNTGVIARTAGPALPLLNDIRRAVAAEAPQMPVYRVETVQQREAEARRATLRASGAVAGAGMLAMLLSAVGLYAVMAFAIGARTREIGIRTALGAGQAQVVRMFFGQGFRLSVVGLLLGLPLSLVAIRVASATLRWPLVSPPLLAAVIAGLVLVVGAAAAWIPARRASAVQSTVALRAD
ncbi:MAG: ABC transporter permease [Gemmatimonadales bacterium]